MIGLNNQIGPKGSSRGLILVIKAKMCTVGFIHHQNGAVPMADLSDPFHVGEHPFVSG